VVRHCCSSGRVTLFPYLRPKTWVNPRRNCHVSCQFPVRAGGRSRATRRPGKHSQLTMGPRPAVRRGLRGTQQRKGMPCPTTRSMMLRAEMSRAVCWAWTAT
jgi:hypothetical protein